MCIYCELAHTGHCEIRSMWNIYYMDTVTALCQVQLYANFWLWYNNEMFWEQIIRLN